MEIDENYYDIINNKTLSQKRNTYHLIWTCARGGSLRELRHMVTHGDRIIQKFQEYFSIVSPSVFYSTGAFQLSGLVCNPGPVPC